MPKIYPEAGPGHLQKGLRVNGNTPNYGSPLGHENRGRATRVGLRECSTLAAVQRCVRIIPMGICY